MRTVSKRLLQIKTIPFFESFFSFGYRAKREAVIIFILLHFSQMFQRRFGTLLIPDRSLLTAVYEFREINGWQDLF